MKPWWLRSHDGEHAHPSVERASAELVGRLSELADQLEALVEEREQELLDDEERRDG